MQVKIDEIDELKSEIKTLTSVVLLLAQNAGCKKTVSVSDIAKMEGISIASLRGKCRHYLPDFGVSQYPDGVDRWDIEKYLSWRSMDINQRKRAYSEQLKRKEQH